MGKIVLFSDLHAHPFRPYSKILEGGVNSRLQDAINCVNQILEYSLKNNVIAVLFGGDLFHVRRTINVAAFNAMHSVLSKFTVFDIPLVLIHGNHDQADKQGTSHSLETFEVFCDVIDTPQWTQVSKFGERINILGVPYTENVEHLKDVVNAPIPFETNEDDINLMLGHLGVQGAKVGADFVYSNPNDATSDDLNSKRFHRVYLGHYHIHQQLNHNSFYIGAPLHHNWGDKNQKRGFLVYDTETNTHEFVELDFPRFIETRDTTDVKLFKGNYVKIITEKPLSVDFLEELRTTTGALSVEFALSKQGQNVAAPRVDINPAKNMSEILETYVKSGVQSFEELDPGYLLSIGRSILEEVDSE